MHLITTAGALPHFDVAQVVDEFPFVDFKKNLKLYLQPIGDIFEVAVLLANAHTCLYGSQTSLKFQLSPPKLEEYFSMQAVYVDRDVEDAA